LAEDLLSRRNYMSMDPMMMGGGEDLDLMAMQEAMGGGAPGGGMDPGAAGGGMVSMQVPEWAVPAVEELVGILEAEVASGNITPDMLANLDGGVGMPDDMAGGMPGGGMGGELPPLPM